MGFGANLAVIAIGAVLAFATHFTLSGIDVRMVGWILMAVGVIGMIIGLTYARPRRALREVDANAGEPVYAVTPEEEEPAYAVVPERPSRWYRLRSRTVRNYPPTGPDGL